MENLNISKETQNFVESATDREVQNQIYITLRKIEIRQNQSVSKLSIISGIAIFYLVCSIIVAIIFAISLSQ